VSYFSAKALHRTLHSSQEKQVNTIYSNAAEAMAVAYAMAKESGKRVWRHTIETKFGATRWVLSFDSDPQNATGRLTA
jgi:hypothetical protein